MNSRFKIWIVVTLVTVIVFSSCRKQQTFPIIPKIEYMSFTLRDTVDKLGNEVLIGRLTFSFVDGDGDIGLRQPQDSSIQEGDPEYSNLFFTLFDMQNGILTEIPEDYFYPPLNYRIPYLEPQGMNKSLEGEVEVEFTYLLFEFDTIKYDFYITDRAGHESNTESTPIFIIPGIGELKK